MQWNAVNRARSTPRRAVITLRFVAQVSKAARMLASDCAGSRIRQASRVLSRAYDDALRPLGIQLSQLMVLVAIANAGDAGAPVGWVAKTLHMDQTTVSRSVRPLEQAGLIELAVSPKDGRSRIVKATPIGKRLIEEAYPIWKAAQRKIERALGSKRFADLLSELARVIELAGDPE
jgi:DNA-binding MarR family transcriptional regulator